MNGWQPIETAPDLEDGVLVVDANKPHPAVGVARFIDGRWRGYNHALGIECYYPTPTHWMRPPAAPRQCEQMEGGPDGWTKWLHPLPGFLLQCCDCDLVHEMEVGIDNAPADTPAFNPGESVENGIVVFRVRRA